MYVICQIVIKSYYTMYCVRVQLGPQYVLCVVYCVLKMNSEF